MVIHLTHCDNRISLKHALDIICRRIEPDKLLEEDQKYISREEDSSVIVLDPDENYEITETLIIDKSVCIQGNGAHIVCKARIGFLISASDVALENLTISEGTISAVIDSCGKNIQNISFTGCRFERYILSGIMTGSAKSNGICRNISIRNCSFKAQLSKNEKGEDMVCALDLILTAACSSQDNVGNAVLDGVCVENCDVLGPSICNFMIVPGLSLDPAKTPQFDRCFIRNIKIAGSRLSGSDDTAVAAQANYINNNKCYFEKLEVVGNICEFGLTGISASAGSPMKGDCDGIFIRDIKILDNILTGKPDVGETRTAIGAGGGGINYYTCSCHNSYVKNLEIRGNRIYQCERGIAITGGSSMIDADAPAELKGNFVEDAVIEGNKLTDVENCFIFYGAWIEGRRFDWNWGKHHTTQTWLPHVEDNSKQTMCASYNCIRRLRCENNQCIGFRYLLRAAGAVGRGHGAMSNNRVDEEICFRYNTFEKGENHILVGDCIIEDWVKDDGGNKVEKLLKNI